MLKDTIIVIPVADVAPESVKRLENLLDSHVFAMGKAVNGTLEDAPETIVCFDACSIDFVEHFQEKYPFIQVIWNKKNRLNFARNSNQGLRECIKRRKHALLVNQDCILPSWEAVEGLTRATGIVSARAVPLEKLEEPNPMAGNPEEWFYRFPTHDLGTFQEVDRVPFYCVFIHNDVLEKIGVLEGAFSRGSFEDDEYCVRAALAGFKCYVSGINVYHEGTTSPGDTSDPNWHSPSGAYDLQVLGQNKNKFYTKYQLAGDCPHEEAHQRILSTHVWQDKMRIS